MKKFFFTAIILLTLASIDSFAWAGYEETTNISIDIPSGNLVRIGPTDDGLHLLNGLGEGDGQRRRGEMLGPVLAESVEGIGVGQDLARFNQGLELIDQGRMGHGGNSQTIHSHPEHASSARGGCFAGLVC